MKSAVWRMRRRVDVALDPLVGALGRVAGPNDTVRAVFPGAAPRAGARAVAVYVHYDRNGFVDDYVLHQLRGFADANVRVVFVTNAPELPDESRPRVAPWCSEIIWRRNVGHDFGAYKDGIAALGDLAKIDMLVLANDSVYGPFQPLPEVLQAARDADVDVWGITDSFQIAYHLQSYFLAFFPAALRSGAFRGFWAGLPYVSKRDWIIRQGEVRLTRVLQRAGLRCGVLAPYRDVAAAAKHSAYPMAAGRRPLPLNPTHHYWDTVIVRFRGPFIKRDLLRANPARIVGLHRWREVVAATGSDLGPIERHLAAPDRPPATGAS